MTYLTRLSFLSDGASGSDVYDGTRHVGWMQPGSIGLCGLASEAAAVVAAGLAHRELSHRPTGKTGEPLPTSRNDRLVVVRLGQQEWVTRGDTAIARLYRPRGHGLSREAEAYAIEIPTSGDDRNPACRDTPTGAWRAAYAAVRAAIGDRGERSERTPNPIRELFFVTRI